MNIQQTFRIPKGKCAAAAIENTIEQAGIQTAIEQYHELKKNHANEYIFDERGFNTVGYNLLNKKKVVEAIEIFKLNVTAYPKSSNVYDSLSEAYMKHGAKELAIENYKKSLELNPNNENAKKMLEKLEE